MGEGTSGSRELPDVADTEALGREFAAGLRPGDRLTSADGQPVGNWQTWVEYVRSHGGRDIVLELEREGATVTLEVRPDLVQGAQGPVGRVGAAVQVDDPRKRLAMMIELAATDTDRTPAPESSSRHPPLPLFVITTVSPLIVSCVVFSPATVA